jgi:AcrR family transcriptional regulator
VDSRVKEAKADSIESLDGRRQRSARSRAAIIEANFELIQEGMLAPTAQQIAERAGVGIRSFFRHFEDMESLASASDDHIRSTYEALWAGGDRSGSLDDRIQRAIERHSDAYEQVAHLILSTRSQLWRSEVLRGNYARNQHKLALDLDHWMPEITQLPSAQRKAVYATASFDMWHRLRSVQAMDSESAVSVVVTLIKTLLNHS